MTAFADAARAVLVFTTPLGVVVKYSHTAPPGTSVTGILNTSQYQSEVNISHRHGRGLMTFDDTPVAPVVTTFPDQGTLLVLCPSTDTTAQS